jgi:hypothetical protein
LLPLSVAGLIQFAFRSNGFDAKPAHDTALILSSRGGAAERWLTTHVAERWLFDRSLAVDIEF